MSSPPPPPPSKNTPTHNNKNRGGGVYSDNLLKSCQPLIGQWSNILESLEKQCSFTVTKKKKNPGPLFEQVVYHDKIGMPHWSGSCTSVHVGVRCRGPMLTLDSRVPTFTFVRSIPMVTQARGQTC